MATDIKISQMPSAGKLSGTEEDPIPYNNNMELKLGKYYSQYEVVYLCSRDTGQAVYNDLKDLIGIYVVIAD